MLIRTFLIKLGIVYDGREAKEAEKDLDDIGKSAARAERPMSKLDRELDETARSAKKAGDASARAGRKIQATGNQAKGAGRKLGGLNKLMGKLGASIASFGPQLAAAGVAGVVAGVGKAISFVGDETARLDRIAKGAQQTGLGIKAYQELDQVATLTGSNIDVLSKGVIKLNRNLADVAGGRGAKINEILGDLGLNFKQLQELDPTQQLAAVSDAFERKGLSEIERTTLSIELFGKAGADLVPLLNAGSDAITEMQGSVGRIFNAEELARAEAYQDALANLTKAGNVLAGSFAVAVAPTLQRGIELFEEALPQAQAFAKGLLDRLVPALRSLGESIQPWVDRLGPSAIEQFKSLLGPIEFVTDALAFSARTIGFFLDAGDQLLRWVEQISDALETRFGPAWESVGNSIERFFAEPLAKVREIAGEVFDFVEKLVSGIGTLGNEVRSIRAAVGLGGGGGSLSSAQAAAAALAAGATNTTTQTGARAAAQTGGQSRRDQERARQRDSFVRSEAQRLQRQAASRPRRRSGGRGRPAQETQAEGGFLEQLGLTAPGAVMANRPAPQQMTIIIAPIIKMIETLTISITGAEGPEQRRAFESAADQAREAVFVRLSELPKLVDMMFRGQAKSLQAAGSSRTLPGGE